MSDRSYASVTFYWCPPEDWSKVRECFNQHGQFTTPDDFDGYPKEWPYSMIDEEVRLTGLHSILQDVAAQTGAIFWGAQDAYYEYPGDLDIRVEEGYFHGEPDNTGQIPLYDLQLTAMIEKASNMKELTEAIEEYAGTTFVKAACEWRDGTRTPQFVIDEQPSIADD